ncbi:MAG: hypothetical protein KJ915_02175 [Candidatus Omnitrophica bacterium]|nr:hypothetical protein [Candidatus Omnitrophota bacterium]
MKVLGPTIKVILAVGVISLIGMILFFKFWSIEGYVLHPISFIEIQSERTKLIDGIESYQSINEFKGFLKLSSLQWEENTNPLSPKGRPPFNITTITIKNYLHLDYSGELIVSFFNNRLTSTNFYPKDVVGYFEAISKEGVTFDSNQEAKLPPHTHVYLAVDHKGRKYVDWADVRLEKEVELWIKRYS